MIMPSIQWNFSSGMLQIEKCIFNYYNAHSSHDCRAFYAIEWIISTFSSCFFASLSPARSLLADYTLIFSLQRKRLELAQNQSSYIVEILYLSFFLVFSLLSLSPSLHVHHFISIKAIAWLLVDDIKMDYFHLLHPIQMEIQFRCCAHTHEQLWQPQ